jgi:hypothetical protein
LPPRVYRHPRKPKSSERLRYRHRRLYGAENTEREKLSGRQKSAGEIPSRRGEIVAIDGPCAWWMTSPLGTPRGRCDEYSNWFSLS